MNITPSMKERMIGSAIRRLNAKLAARETDDFNPIYDGVELTREQLDESISLEVEELERLRSN